MATETTHDPATTGSSVVPVISHWIDGRPMEVPPEVTGPVYDPSTGQVIARVPRGGSADVDAAVASANREAGLVRADRSGTFVHYSLEPAALDRMAALIGSLRPRVARPDSVSRCCEADGPTCS